MRNYTAIFELAAKLRAANIPFEFHDRSVKEIGYVQYQIEYPCGSTDKKRRRCSVIEGDGSYGRFDDLLEIMGLLTAEEEKYDAVVGSLTVEEVFNRIQADYRNGGWK